MWHDKHKGNMGYEQEYKKVYTNGMSFIYMTLNAILSPLYNSSFSVMLERTGTTVYLTYKFPNSLLSPSFGIP